MEKINMNAATITADSTKGHHDAHGDSGDHHASYGWMRWVTTTNHKDIGYMYLITAFTMLLTGGAMIFGGSSGVVSAGLAN
jgi:cytochrome c oxidase subunit 1